MLWGYYMEVANSINLEGLTEAFWCQSINGTVLYPDDLSSVCALSNVPPVYIVAP